MAPPKPLSPPPVAPSEPAPSITSPHRNPYKKLAPPPPPPAVDQQQTAGLSLRKISALAYTITPGHSTKSESAKTVIEDTQKRFKFVNANALPHPRRFGDDAKEKLYPSGRGLSVPLDLSLYT